MTDGGRSRLSRSWMVATAILLAAGFLYQIDGYPLLDPDEGRNAEVAREMAVANDYVLPHLNGLPYVDKPVLFFATQALLMEALGPTVLAARLAPLLFTVAALGVVTWFASILVGPGGRGTALVATATTPFVLAYSRTVIFDSAVMLWVLLALIGSYQAVERRVAGSGDGEATPGAAGTAGWWAALAWGAMGVGVLTKGPIALAVPLMVAVPYALWRRAARALFDPTALLLFAAVVMPWVFTVDREVPGFLEYALVTETARRLTTDELGRTGPVWYFAVIFPVATLPWSVVLLGALWRRRPATWRSPDHRAVFLAAWMLVPLLFFTLSQSKRPQYLLPLVPAVGLAIARLWHGVAGRLPGVRSASVLVGGFGLFLLAVGHDIASWIPAATGNVAAEIPATAAALGSVCLIAGIGGWFAARWRWPVLFALGLPVASIAVVSHGLMHAIGEDRSARALAESIEAAIGERGEVVGVAAYPPSLPFYLRRTITLSTVGADELTSNYIVRHLELMRAWPGTPLRPGDWWYEAARRCRVPTVFVTRATDRSAVASLGQQLPLIITTRKYSAFGPCGGGLMASGRVAAASP